MRMGLAAATNVYFCDVMIDASDTILCVQTAKMHTQALSLRSSGLLFDFVR